MKSASELAPGLLKHQTNTRLDAPPSPRLPYYLSHCLFRIPHCRERSKILSCRMRPGWLASYLTWLALCISRNTLAKSNVQHRLLHPVSRSSTTQIGYRLRAWPQGIWNPSFILYDFGKDTGSRRCIGPVSMKVKWLALALSIQEAAAFSWRPEPPKGTCASETVVSLFLILPSQVIPTMSQLVLCTPSPTCLTLMQWHSMSCKTSSSSPSATETPRAFSSRTANCWMAKMRRQC